jgi:hypothetical protein
MMRLLTILLLCFLSAQSNALDLTSGVISRGRDTVSTSVEKDAARVMVPIIKRNYAGTYQRGIGYTNLGSGNTWYRLTRDLRLHVVDTAQKQYLGNVELLRPSTEYIPPEVTKRYSDFHHEYPTEYAAKYVRGLGCFQDTPLRYGDINNDGTDEVVLFLANDIVLFSPDKERIIFSEQLSIDDWLSLEDTAEEPENKSLPAPPSYQYLSSMLMDVREYQPGYRGYSKLYFGDFDEDGNADILVWRKFYESYEQASKTKGFKKLHDNFQHYERQSGADSSGEFNVQVTDVADIQQWLTASQLTWSKGYPSKSECAGQEGQLIPEMHDPLLNDPDVLK